MKKLLIAICLVSTVLFAGKVIAASATGSFSVTASVTAGCTVSADTLAFGVYSGSDLINTNTITETCTLGTTISSITLSLGDNYSGGTRRMKNGSYYLNYSLYSDSGRTTVWDMVTTPTPPSPDGTAQFITVYGRIPSGQLAGAGVGGYTDTITVTINY